MIKLAEQSSTRLIFQIFIVDGDEEAEVANQLNDIKSRMDQILSGKAPLTPKSSSANLLSLSTKNSDADQIGSANGALDDKGNEIVKDGTNYVCL